jgi:hypothetical protein
MDKMSINYCKTQTLFITISRTTHENTYRGERSIPFGLPSTEFYLDLYTSHSNSPALAPIVEEQKKNWQCKADNVYIRSNKTTDNGNRYMARGKEAEDPAELRFGVKRSQPVKPAGRRAPTWKKGHKPKASRM